MALRASLWHDNERTDPMYALEITCLNCSEKLIFEREQLWRIVILSHEFELQILEEKLSCKPCQQIGPMKLIVNNVGMSSLVVFEKIIPTTPYFEKTSTNTISSKLSIEQPCILCTAKGHIEVQYKAHKKSGSFKGILNETCPICSGKGYFKN